MTSWSDMRRLVRFGGIGVKPSGYFPADDDPCMPSLPWRGKGRMEDTGGVVFAIAGLLGVIAFLPRLAARLRLPYTVLLAALGCAIGAMLGLSNGLLDALP